MKDNDSVVGDNSANSSGGYSYKSADISTKIINFIILEQLNFQQYQVHKRIDR
jgi:hypothetical protein